MKLLFDQNLSYKLVRALAQEFPESTHVRDVGLASAEDLAVWEYAKESGFIIVSKDTDFRQRSFVFGAPPKVIWLRLGNCSTERIENILRLYRTEIRQFESDLESSFLVIDPSLEATLTVDSSVITSIAYDPQSQILEIEFKESGEVYRYFDVPATAYEGLLKAASKGRYLNSQIKEKYRFQKVF